MPSILYVDDEAPLRRAVTTWLRRHGVEVHTAKSVRGAKRCLTQLEFDGAFLDIWLDDGTGFELYEWIQSFRPRLASNIVFVTGDSLATDKTKHQLKALGRAVLVKPFDLEELETYIDMWVARQPKSAVASQHLQLSG